MDECVYVSCQTLYRRFEIIGSNRLMAVLQCLAKNLSDDFYHRLTRGCIDYIGLDVQLSVLVAITGSARNSAGNGRYGQYLVPLHALVGGGDTRDGGVQHQSTGVGRRGICPRQCLIFLREYVLTLELMTDWSSRKVCTLTRSFGCGAGYSSSCSNATVS